jgi:STE24 endopeptidase
MSFLLTSAFVGFLLLMVGLKYWLAWRQIRHVSLHATRCPASSPIASRSIRIARPPPTVAKTRLASSNGGGVVLLVALTARRPAVAERCPARTARQRLLYQMAVVAAVVVLASIVDLLLWVRQFRIEQRFDSTG